MHFVRPRKTTLQDVVDDRRARPVECLLSDRRAVEHATEREDVDASIVMLRLDLLRRHVRDLALHLAGLGLLVHLIARTRDPEVGDLHPTVDREEDVVRRDVAMNQLDRNAFLVMELVSGVEPGARVGDDPRRDVRREHALRHLSDELSNGAGHPLHDEEEASRFLPHVDDGADVRVLDRRGKARLVEEHLAVLFVERQVVVRDLERDQPFELRVPELARSPHCAHATSSDRNEQLITTVNVTRANRRFRQYSGFRLEPFGCAVRLAGTRGHPEWPHLKCYKCARSARNLVVRVLALYVRSRYLDLRRSSRCLAALGAHAGSRRATWATWAT